MDLNNHLLLFVRSTKLWL